MTISLKAQNHLILNKARLRVTLLSDSAVILKQARKFDRVVLAIIALTFVLVILNFDQAKASLNFTLDALVGISGFLLLSVSAAAFAKATGLDQQIARVFSGNPIKAILAAAIFGAISPFCSCGVVPIIAGLLLAGVPLAPVMAFWLASPLMDPQIFFLMLPVFGVAFTLTKLLSAILIGASAGLILHGFNSHRLLQDPLLIKSVGCGSGICGANKSLEQTSITWQFWKEVERRELFINEAWLTGWFLLRWLTLAFILESLMVTYIPAEEIGRYLGGTAWWAIPGSVLLGIPAYLNGFAAIPTVGGLVNLGMAPGAAMGFMIAGGVTSIPAAMAVFALVKKPVFLVYISWGLLGSLGTAYFFQVLSTLTV
jgi:uncharacterized membrane protein YraQ (UPF0718 family)